MANTSGSAPKQFRVQKDNGELWTVTYGGPQRVRWDRVDASEEPEIPEPANPSREALPADGPALDWAIFFSELLLDLLEEAKPYIEVLLLDVVVPWVKTTAKSAWKRATKKRSPASVRVSVPEKEDVSATEVRITDLAPSKAIALSRDTNETVQTHSLNLTPEEAQRRLEDIERLTRILAARVRVLTNSLTRAEGESEEHFLERRKQAEQHAVRNVTSNVRGMLEQGTDLSQAIVVSASYTPVFAAGSVDTASLNLEGLSQAQHRDPLRISKSSLRQRDNGSSR